MNRLRPVMIAVALLASSAFAQTVDQYYSGTYTLFNLGSFAGVPTSYGGLVFKAGDPNTILLGGAANGRGASMPFR